MANKKFSKQSTVQLTAFFIFGTLILYCFGFAFIYRRKKSVLLTGIICLFFLVVAAWPFLTNGLFFTDNALFDTRFINSLGWFSWLPLTPVVKIFITYQLIPLLLLIGLHAVIVRFIKNIYLVFAITAGIVTLAILYYTDILQYYATFFIQGKKIALIGIAITFASIGFLWLLFWLYKHKRQRLFYSLICFFLLSLFVLQNHQIFQTKRAVITAFELEALDLISKQDKQVIAVAANYKEHGDMYRAVKPLLSTDPVVRQWLTGKSWRDVTREEVEKKAIHDAESKLIFVPPFQGSFLYTHEIKKYKMKKVFDNAQIELYENDK